MSTRDNTGYVTAVMVPLQEKRLSNWDNCHKVLHAKPLRAGWLC